VGVETFEVPAPSLVAVGVGGAIAIAMIGLAAVFLVVLVKLRKVRFEVTDHTLAIIAPIYGRTIDKSKLRLEESRVVKLANEPALKLRRRTNGLALPGVRLGWFRLASDERALVFIARGEVVLYVPTSEGFPVLLETADAAGLLEALRT